MPVREDIKFSTQVPLNGEEMIRKYPASNHVKQKIVVQAIFSRRYLDYFGYNLFFRQGVN